MAQLEVSFHYKQASRNKAIAIGLLWIGFGAMLLPIVAQLVVQTTQIVHMPLFFGYCLQLGLVVGSAILYTYLPFRLAMSCLQGNTILINEHGIGVPGGLLGKASWFDWPHLKLAKISNKQLELHFNNRVVNLDTAKIEETNLEKVLMAIEVWGHKTTIENSLIDTRDALQNKRIGVDSQSYTQLWEEELNRRFNSTTFVPLEPGQKLASGKLTIKKQLAFGGFSSVYLAQNDLGVDVVVKESVINADDANSEKASEFFNREALYLAKLNHGQIAQALDAFVENGRNYLVLQYVSGETLREYVRRHGPISETRVGPIIVQMAKVLDYMHSQDPPIIHRDFTPDNMILRGDDTIVVIDFGAANEFIGTATGTLIGKQCYIPPEQIRGKSEPSTDYYALGCTAAFLLTGKDPVALATCHPRQMKADISENMDRLVSELTDLNPKTRLQTAEEVSSRLAEATKHLGGKT
ncbi:MAG TPA: serine/threonine-protein kinase [Drouetiella sp.]